MPATCRCPNINCRKIVSVGDEMRGKIVLCGTCKTPFRVPPQSAATPAAKKSA